MDLARTILRKVKHKAYQVLPGKGDNFHSCNLCGWTGKEFASNDWHRYSTCPYCGSDVRHRLFVASLEYANEISLDLSLKDKRVLHFAPEPLVGHLIARLADDYVTADYMRDDCDVRLDMCDMREIHDSAIDVVIAFDVLEHVPSFSAAIKEIRRILSAANGVAVLSVPQRDNLGYTDEDPSITLPKDREKAYGQWDHLRIFGDNFSAEVEKEGFRVSEISWKSFNDIVSLRHMLKHPIPNQNPNATNNRRLYICYKV